MIGVGGGFLQIRRVGRCDRALHRTHIARKAVSVAQKGRQSGAQHRKEALRRPHHAGTRNHTRASPSHNWRRSGRARKEEGPAQGVGPPSWTEGGKGVKDRKQRQQRRAPLFAEPSACTVQALSSSPKDCLRENLRVLAPCPRPVSTPPPRPPIHGAVLSSCHAMENMVRWVTLPAAIFLIFLFSTYKRKNRVCCRVRLWGRTSPSGARSLHSLSALGHGKSHGTAVAQDVRVTDGKDFRGPRSVCPVHGALR